MIFLSTFQNYILPAIVLALTGGILGVFISLASIAFYVELDTRVEDVLGMLPGLNCGMCGYPGCEGLAEAIINDGANPVLCKPGTQEMREKIKAYFDELKTKEAES